MALSVPRRSRFECGRHEFRPMTSRILDAVWATAFGRGEARSAGLKGAERPRFSRKRRLLHPREKRSTLQVLGDVACRGARECLGLVSLVAAEAFPGPVAPDERAQIIDASRAGGQAGPTEQFAGFMCISLVASARRTGDG